VMYDTLCQAPSPRRHKDIVVEGPKRLTGFAMLKVFVSDADGLERVPVSPCITSLERVEKS
jgi:hypothetical protein